MKKTLLIALASLMMASCYKKDTAFDNVTAPYAGSTNTNSGSNNNTNGNASGSTNGNNSSTGGNTNSGSHQCGYRTKKGTPCKRMVSDGYTYCWQHR